MSEMTQKKPFQFLSIVARLSLFFFLILSDISSVSAQSARVVALGFDGPDGPGLQADIVQGYCGTEEPRELEKFDDDVVTFGVANQAPFLAVVRSVRFKLKDALGNVRFSRRMAAGGVHIIPPNTTATVKALAFDVVGKAKFLPPSDKALTPGFYDLTAIVELRFSSGARARRTARVTVSLDDIDRCE